MQMTSVVGYEELISQLIHVGFGTFVLIVVADIESAAALEAIATAGPDLDPFAFDFIFLDF